MSLQIIIFLRYANRFCLTLDHRPMLSILVLSIENSKVIMCSTSIAHPQANNQFLLNRLDSSPQISLAGISIKIFYSCDYPAL